MDKVILIRSAKSRTAFMKVKFESLQLFKFKNIVELSNHKCFIIHFIVLFSAASGQVSGSGQVSSAAAGP